MLLLIKLNITMANEMRQKNSLKINGIKSKQSQFKSKTAAKELGSFDFTMERYGNNSNKDSHSNRKNSERRKTSPHGPSVNSSSVIAGCTIMEPILSTRTAYIKIINNKKIQILQGVRNAICIS